MELNWADYAVIGIILLSTLISLIRGFVKEAVSLATWVIAVWVVLQFSPWLAGYLVELSDAPTLRLGAAALILFVGTLIVGAIINYIISQLVDKTGFSGTDRTLGVVFGALRGVLVVALVVIMASLTPFPQDPWWKQSYLLPVFQEKVVYYKAYLPDQIEKNFNFDPAPSAGGLSGSGTSAQPGGSVQEGMPAQQDILPPQPVQQPATEG